MGNARKTDTNLEKRAKEIVERLQGFPPHVRFGPPTAEDIQRFVREARAHLADVKERIKKKQIGSGYSTGEAILQRALVDLVSPDLAGLAVDLLEVGAAAPAPRDHEKWREVMEYVRANPNVVSERQIAKGAEVPRSTLRDWIKSHPADFALQRLMGNIWLDEKWRTPRPRNNPRGGGHL